MTPATSYRYPGESPAESSHTKRLPPSRVAQVDAVELDEALVGMLSERVGRALANFKSSFSVDLKPEIELVIKLVIFRFSIWNSNWETKASPGAKLQNLKLVHSGQPMRRILLLYLLLHPPIFPKYLMTRIRQYALSSQWPDLPRHDWRRKAWNVLIRMENGARLWELVGWTWFLYDGIYPSLLMRLLKLRLVPSQAHLTRLVSYEFMNRQLVWSAFTEFLMFSVPLIPPLPPLFTPSSLITPIRSFLSQPTTIDYSSIPLVSPTTVNAQDTKTEQIVYSGPLAHLPKSTCPICYIRLSSAPVPLNPSTAAGSTLNLPPISVHANFDADGGKETEFSHEDELDEMRIHIPARTDCQGGCEWCYYCIRQELYKHREERVTVSSTRGNDKGKNVEEEKKWSCLRCGGGVNKAWRVGSDMERITEDVL